MQLENNTVTVWDFSGLFFGGDCDRAGTPIGDICTGTFVTSTADRAVAEAALLNRYANLSGRFSIRSLEGSEAGKTGLRIYKRGGTKQIPLLA